MTSCAESYANGWAELASGNGPKLWQALEPLAQVKADSWTINELGAPAFSGCEHDLLMEALKGLHPWRKGPFQFADVFVDSEWRSNIKWQRLENAGINWQNKRVCDIGSGNAYYAWRMIAAGAQHVTCVEPMVHAGVQFSFTSQLVPNTPIAWLPIPCQDLPRQQALFDCVCSMGVLYHRRDHLDHLRHLYMNYVKKMVRSSLKH